MIAPPAPPAATDGARPQRADGLELLGEYRGSGFKEPQYVVRRSDGQVIQLPLLLYSIVEHADGAHDSAEIAERVTEDSKRGVSADNIDFLVEKKLRPLGVLAAADGSSPELRKLDPLLALKFRAALVPPRAVRAITALFKPLFFPVAILAAIGGLIAVDVWLFFFHGIAASVREILYNPVLLLVVLGVVVLSAAFHEIGHATACAYGGAQPGAMGAGIYVIWPAFYTDVTDAYRLGKGGRLRTDLGGVYFNAIFALGTVAVYFATGYEPLLLIVLVQHFQILQQLLPFLRLDGYYVISDLTGVPDMFARIKPTLKSLIPWRETDVGVQELKPWARVVVTLYVLITVPALLLVLGLVLMNAPRIFATGYDSFVVQLQRFQDATSTSDRVTGTVQMAVLALPSIGLAATFARGGHKLSTAAWHFTEPRPFLRAVFALGTAAAIGFLAYTWWPNGEYRPIQPGERGTVQGAISQLRHVGSGRPSLPPERQRELKGAPTLRSLESQPVPSELPETPANETTTLPTPTTTTPAETPTTTTETTYPSDTTATTETETYTTETTTTETLTTETSTTETATTETVATP